MNARIGTLTLAACLPLLAFAQDDAEPQVEEKRTGVIVIQEDDGTGPSEPEVIILEGDELDAFELDLPPGATEGKATRIGKLSVMGPDGKPVTIEMDLDSEGGEEAFQEHMQRVRKMLKERGVELPQGFDPEAMAERMAKAKVSRAKAQAARAKRERDQILEALKLEPDVREVIAPLLDRVLEAKRELDRGQRSGRKLLLEDAKRSEDDAALRGLLAAHREKVQGARKALSSAQESLRELLTLRQELELVLRDVLD